MQALRAPARRVALRAAAPRSLSIRPTHFRRFATEAPKPEGSGSGSSNTLLFAGIGGGIVAAGAAYLYFSSDSAGTTAKKVGQAAKVAANFVPTQEDYQKVYNAIAEKLEKDPEYDDGSYGPVVLRLAWHASGTYDKETNTGGSNYATMRFAPESLHGANAGLNIARNYMEDIKQQFPWISYGDLWTLGGVAAVQEMGGPTIHWRPGRIDGTAEKVTPDGRLPDASQGPKHLRDIFYRMGFNDQEIVALSGAHALGRCHADRSGFDGPWSFSPVTMSNEYFRLLLQEKWVWRSWEGPKQLEDKSTKSLMMLPTDYCLVQDKAFKPWVKAYAADEALFFKDFAKVVETLFELGVPRVQFVPSEPWAMKRIEEQTPEKK